MDLSLQRVELAVSFIEAHLGEEFSLQDVAHATGVTRFSLHRFFRACVGETLKGYIRKRRLTEAANKLRYSSMRIIELALEAGFQSQEAFTRAFQSYYGVTPGRYRKDVASRRQPGLFRFSSELLIHRYEGISQEPRIVERESPLLVHGWGVATDMEEDAPIFALWERVLEVFGQMPEPPETLYAVSQSEHPDIPMEQEHCLAYLAGATPELWPVSMHPFVAGNVPSGLYAVFEHQSSLEHIIHTINYIWASWLPQCPYQKSERPDLEVINWPSFTSPEPSIELWISIDEH